MGTASKESETVFRSEGWLRATALNEENVLDYFSISPFYDSSQDRNNNEAARAAGLHPWSEDSLSQMPTGPERFDYSVARSSAPYAFVIRKRSRDDTGSGTTSAGKTLSEYYVLDGSVYAAPSLHSLLLCRLARCTYSARSALVQLTGSTDPSPSSVSPATSDAEQLEDSLGFDASPMQPQTLDGILASVLDKHAPANVHSQVPASAAHAAPE